MKRLLLTLLIAAISVTTVTAQTDIPENKKAILCFDLKVNEILQSDLVKSLGEDGMAEFNRGMQFPVPAEKYTRIFGLMGAPNSIAEAMPEAPQMDKVEKVEDGAPRFSEQPEFQGAPDIPFGMIFEFQMVDAEAAKLLLEKMDFNLEQAQQIKGIDYHSPAMRFAPKNIVAGIKDGTTVVLGTKNFVAADSMKDLFSNELAKTWSRHGDAPGRLSVEMVSKATMINEVLAMSKEGAPPMMGPMLELVDNIESLNLVIDPAASEMIALRGLGKSDGEAVELRGGVDGLLGLAKLSAGGLTAEMSETPKAAAMVGSIISDLKTSGEGRDVNIIINRPEGFNEGVAEIKTMMITAGKLATRKNNIRQLMLASLNYESANQKFPFAGDTSWRTQIAPFMFSEEGAADQMPEVFGTDGKTALVAHVRADKIPTGFADIKDGSSNTICLIEFPAGIPWKENRDVTSAQVLEMVANLEEGKALVAALYDGSTITLRKDVDPELIKKMCTPAGGETIEWDEMDALYR